MPVPSLSECIQEIRAGAAVTFKAQGGNPEEFDSFCRRNEVDFLCAARNLRDEKLAEAHKITEAQAKTQAQATLKRSEMTAQQKGAFIHEHGTEAFKALPW